MNQNNLCVGLVAHVDAGKTTLAEAMLYLSGAVKKLGRVDHRSSFLDTHSLERQRGITIFSKQAALRWANTDITLLDTPGHVDFSAEMERSLPVLDCAVLVISGSDGVQAHTETLWRLLKRHRVPTFLFITKMDLTGAEEAALTEELSTRLDGNCMNFSTRAEDFDEQIAMCSETAMNRFLQGQTPDAALLTELMAERLLFPCFFGSGLHLDGVAELLDALTSISPRMRPEENFGAQIFKITRDAKGSRLSFMRLTGGSLKVRDTLDYTDEHGERHQEKITQLRLYSGDRYQAAESVSGGQIAAVLGLSASFPGQTMGAAEQVSGPVLEPVLTYRLILPPDTDAAALYPRLTQLQEEDPQLHLQWQSRERCIHVSLMGRVQKEVFCELVRERFDLEISLDRGQILYRETIADTVEGIGHFEPLRHYAEVHLLLSPLPPGSGVVYDSCCSEDELDRNWQRLILSCLADRQHLGVLTGSPLTDVRITLAAGKAHLKHTEGGDFREAAYRAVRQGLMQATGILLEPWYDFTLEIPAEQLGRALGDIHAMHGEFKSPEGSGEILRLTGSAPVKELNGYQTELLAYTHGRGRLSLCPGGYRPCREQADVVAAMGYDPESDTENTPDSVFCAHGAGFNVRWARVPEYMHLESCLKPRSSSEASMSVSRRDSAGSGNWSIDDRELEAIMEREFGPIRRPQYMRPQRGIPESSPTAPVQEPQKETVIVDGYNLIYAWPALKELAGDRMDLARERLQDILSSYCGFTRNELVLVFDGYRSPDNPGSHLQAGNIRIAYTKGGETGDAYIERLVDEIGKNYHVRVVTSDNLIRLSALRSGVLRTGSAEFVEEVTGVLKQIEALLQKTNEQEHLTRDKGAVLMP
ncbi:MAG: TetM/TetW/TetO/TetS family tetracycline resistance ribosomal protection protein [Oscillospiraceae bacterium]|nr:TetM/TetW/TetO/TetS family tetracycline resistance ribosomal protection protein [Oscillospiraceae bacterium]